MDDIVVLHLGNLAWDHGIVIAGIPRRLGDFLTRGLDQWHGIIHHLVIIEALVAWVWRLTRF